MKIREKIAQYFQDELHVDKNTTPIPEMTDDLLTIIREAGYVKLADDQSCPEQSYVSKAHIGADSSQGYQDAQEDMLAAGWRKVKEAKR